VRSAYSLLFPAIPNDRNLNRRVPGPSAVLKSEVAYFGIRRGSSVDMQALRIVRSRRHDSHCSEDTLSFVKFVLQASAES
jgi:hypothetical protein